jgi:DNA-directed RNA polymerase subunit M/transcription elongation factor TFIIS
MQCPKDGCDGEEAAFFQVQIRSADEPMTGFYKVSLNWQDRKRKGTNGCTVYDLWA